MMKLRKLMALAIIATIALLSSCSSDSSDTSDGSDNGATGNGSEATGDSSWDDIVAAAQEEGRVVVYSSATTAQITRIEEAFESEFDGIDVEIVSLTSGEQVNRLMQEFDTNQVGADIAWNAQPNFFREIDAEGKLEAPVGPADENFPDDYRLNDGARLLYALPIPIIWNTNQVPDGVENYDDLTNPAFQGRLALADIDAGNSLVDFYKWLEENNPGILEELATQNPKFYVAPAEADQGVASSELHVSAYSGLPSATALQEQGAPIEIKVTDPAFSSTTFGGILSDATNKNAAQVFMNWLLSENGQMAIVGDQTAASPIDVEGSVSPIGTMHLYWADESQDEIDEFTAEWKSIFSR